MLGRIYLIFAVTFVMLFLFVFGVVFILVKGPSEEACRIFSLSCFETSAGQWIPGVFLSDEEIEAIKQPVTTTDTTEIFPTATEDTQTADSEDTAQEVTYTSNIEVIDVKGSTYKGKVMLIHDPSHVFFGAIDSFGGTGMTLSQFLEKYNAIGCVNAGGFLDEGGTGKGGDPDGMVIQNGQLVYGSAEETYKCVAGFDADHVLHVGNMTGQQALNAGIVNGTSFDKGPIIIQDGVRQTGFVSGLNPRTSIGQAADGTVILVAVEGRLADSLGASFEDIADIMESYGAVNAANMDGGSSSGMYYEGERITRSSSIIGDRPLPTAIMVVE